MAYPAPPANAVLTSGCASVTTGANCTYTFEFTDSTGAGVDGLSVNFVLDLVPGCTISPTSGTTSGGGFASTTLTCASNAGTGTDTLTASSGSVSASATININPANAGGGGGNLPFTSTNPPGPNGWLIAGLVLAAAIIAAGASYLTVGRRRRTA